MGGRWEVHCSASCVSHGSLKLWKIQAFSGSCPHTSPLVSFQKSRELFRRLLLSQTSPSMELPRSLNGAITLSRRSNGSTAQKIRDLNVTRSQPQRAELHGSNWHISIVANAIAAKLEESESCSDNLTIRTGRKPPRPRSGLAPAEIKSAGFFARPFSFLLHPSKFYTCEYSCSQVPFKGNYYF